MKVIDNNGDLEIVESRMDDLKRLYFSVQEKHEEYVSTLSSEDSNPEVEDEWISTIDDEFDESEIMKVSYVRKRNAEKDNEDKMYDNGKLESMQQQCLSMRTIEEKAFNSILTSLRKKIETQMSADEPILDIIKDELSDLKRQLDACKQSHLKYIATLIVVSQTQINWISDLQDILLDTNTTFSLLAEKRAGKKRCGLRLERIKLPKFEGNIRDYPRFRADFTRQVLPEYKNDTHAAAYTLKSCLSSGPLSVVRNVDDNLTEMWKRLDESMEKLPNLQMLL